MTSIELRQLNSYITALEFISDDILLAGEGPNLVIYDVASMKRKKVLCLLATNNLHGIRKNINNDSLNKYTIAVFGGKQFKILTIDRFEISEEFVNDAVDLEDWIWDIKWLSGDSLAIVLGHNSVLRYDWRTRRILKHVHCEEKCILYSAKLIGDSWNNLILASGTVFNQVVLSPMNIYQQQLDGEGRVKVMHRLLGHQGVIFGIDYNKVRKVICSVSDDRSIRLWRVVHQGVGEAMDWNTATFDLLRVLYGHSARVWSVRLLDESFVSAGEDAVCCLWNYDGQIVQKFKGHKGKSIWSMAVNSDETFLATGGGDSSIRIWSLKTTEGTSTAPCHVANVYVQFGEGDYPRIVRLFGEKILIMTNEGSLYSYCPTSGLCTTILDRDVGLRSYCLMEPSFDTQMLLLASIAGQIRLYFQGRWFEKEIYVGKIYSILWLTVEDSANMFLTTGPEGDVIIWKIVEDGITAHIDIQMLHHVTLPYAKHRWVTAAIYLQSSDLVICGDRNGSIHVFNTIESLAQQSFVGLHGKAGVTDTAKYDQHIYSCGRDGQFVQFNIDVDGKMDIVQVNKVFKGFDWIERLSFTQDDMLVFGFHTDQFIVRSINHNQTLVSIPCGGGHRSWHYRDIGDSSMFVYIKSKAVLLNCWRFTKQQTILKHPLHGREMTDVKCLWSAGLPQGYHIFATASEDTTINIIAVSDTSTITVLDRLHGHISSVRTICSSNSDSSYSTDINFTNSTESSKAEIFQPTGCGSSSKLLFSAGGRAQLKAWRVHSHVEQNSLSEDLSHESNIASSSLQEKHSNDVSVTESRVSCRHEALASHMLFEKRSRRRRLKVSAATYDPETRYMALTAFDTRDLDVGWPSGCHIIAAACSGGLARIFLFNENSKQFSYVANLVFHNHCLLSIAHVIHSKSTNHMEAYIFTGASDGRIAIWNISETIGRFRETVIQSKETTGNGNNSNVQIDDVDTEVNQKFYIINKPNFVIECHQSGVNCISIKRCQGSTYLLASGGDDNSLSVHYLHIDDAIIVESSVKHSTAHCAQITGISIVEKDLIMTASIDQRLSLWTLFWSSEVGSQHCSLLRIEFVSCKFVNVADISKLEIWKDSAGCLYGALCGVGLQVFKVDSSLCGVSDRDTKL